MRRVLRALGGLALCAALPAAAGAFGRDDVGTTGAQFLKIAPGARPAAMGEAYTGVADDAYSLYYNPAGLGLLQGVQVAAMHHARFEGVNYEYGALAVPMLSWVETQEAKNAWGVLALGISNLSVGNIERRSNTETDQPVDTFGASDFAYTLGYGLAPWEGVSFGGGLKLIDQTIDASHAAGWAMDLGALYREGRYSAGLALRNAGASSRFSNEDDPLPLTVALGGSVKPADGWLAAMDVRVPRDNHPGVSVGGEYSRKFSKDLAGAMRLGFSSSNRDPEGLSGLSLGAGVTYGSAGFDFAWTPLGDLGDTFRYSLLVRF